MDLMTLQDLVQEGEHEHLEFKRKASDVFRIMREVVAFANAKGGTLLIGVSDNGIIPGLKYPDDHAFVMEKGFSEHLRPTLNYSHGRVLLKDGRQVLYYRIKESVKKPVELIKKPTDRYGEVYLRYQDKSMHLHREGRLVLKGLNLEISKPVTFEEPEKLLMNHLSDHQSISVNEFARLSNLNLREAGNRLVNMAINHIITLYPTERGERFIRGTRFIGVKG
jgi:predicted HTH transcriptional regulator